MNPFRDAAQARHRAPLQQRGLVSEDLAACPTFPDTCSNGWRSVLRIPSMWALEILAQGLIKSRTAPEPGSVDDSESSLRTWEQV